MIGRKQSQPLNSQWEMNLRAAVLWDILMPWAFNKPAGAFEPLQTRPSSLFFFFSVLTEVDSLPDADLT